MRVSYDDDLRLAHVLADAVERVTMARFRAEDLRVETKPDLTPVSDADRAAEELIRHQLARTRPRDAVEGEEFGTTGHGPRRWILDPIDGTKAFITGLPLFGTLIGLFHKGKPVLGIIDQPILQERWLGVDGERSTLNGKPISVRACAGVASAYMYSTAPAMFAGGHAKPHQALTEKVKLFRWGGDCYAYGLLAAGHVDLVVEADLKLYDYAALIPVITGAGGTITDWKGKALDMQSDGAVVAAGDRAVHRAALDILSA